MLFVIHLEIESWNSIFFVTIWSVFTSEKVGGACSNLGADITQHMPFPLSCWKLNNHSCQQFSLFLVCKVFISSRSSTACHFHMHGWRRSWPRDLDHHDMYPFLAVYQRLFDQLIKILPSFALIGRQWSFLSILVNTAWFYWKRL